MLDFKGTNWLHLSFEATTFSILYIWKDFPSHLMKVDETVILLDYHRPGTR